MDRPCSIMVLPWLNTVSKHGLPWFSSNITMVNNLIFDQERMSCACTQHIFISIEHASHRFTNPESGITENHGQ